MNPDGFAKTIDSVGIGACSDELFNDWGVLRAELWVVRQLRQQLDWRCPTELKHRRECLNSFGSVTDTRCIEEYGFRVMARPVDSVNESHYCASWS